MAAKKKGGRAGGGAKKRGAASKRAEASKKRAATAKGGAKRTGAKRSAAKTAARAVKFAKVAADPALDNLNKIDHIVVLLMENRSFDHMLGYLTLQGQSEVDGLSGSGEQLNRWQGSEYRPQRLGTTRIPKSQDPCHSAACVREQLEDRNGKFVENFAKYVDADFPGIVMGYYTGDQLPAYDYLAHSFCLCDRWHSSVPGSTWPNRLFSIAGRADPEQEGLSLRHLFDLPAFVRQLSDEQWRWYSHDPGTLRLVDSRYRPGHGKPHEGLWQDNFRFFDRKAATGLADAVADLSQLEGGEAEEQDSFLDDAANGELPAVSWIDPNFIDLSIGERNSNDDHPPSDIRAAQQLVLATYRALVEGPKRQWERTLLVVTYDEHGGFYDHVPPPETGDPEPYERYGVRVPAFLISPWVEPASVCHELFDHTSLIKTILLRFAPEGLAQMPERVQRAKHLGVALTRERPAPIRNYFPAVEKVTSWRSELTADAIAASPLPRVAPPRLRGFQAEMLLASQRLRSDGLPAGHP